MSQDSKLDNDNTHVILSASEISPPRPSSMSNSGTTGPMSFRRQRASRACETCHARKVRCDAARLGVPCTNCTAFEIACSIPSPKRKKKNAPRQTSQSPSSPHAAQILSDGFMMSGTQLPHTVGSETHQLGVISGGGQNIPVSPRGLDSKRRNHRLPRQAQIPQHTPEGTPSTTLTDAQVRKEMVDSSTFVDIVMKPKFTRAPITEAGRVAYLGESSNLTLLVHDRQGSDDVVHYPLPHNVRGSRARLTELDTIEIDILKQRGAFLLPPRVLCDELIDSYFRWVHPIMPIINRTKFMRHYNDADCPPSLLLLQAVLLAGSRVCNSPQLVDSNGSTTPAALTFYKRAKALYDANYEDDRVTIVQSLLLMGWYWEGPEDSTANTFYYSRVATIVAQGSGMHRSVERSQLSRTDKRLWKRIWWTLFTRDRSVAVALGRPVHINLDDSDVEMVTEDDFIEDDECVSSNYPPDPIHVHFFLQYVKLCEIMGLVLSQQYSVAFKGRPRTSLELSHSDMALADWLRNCPKSVYWEPPRHHFWSALLHSNYYTTLCLLHRAHMPPQCSNPHRTPGESIYPSQNIAFQAAAMITSIIENLSSHDELRYCPAFVVYSLFSALIMHVYQMRSPIPSIQQVTKNRIHTCMQALKQVSRIWLVAKMVHTLFESILGNKGMEERLQRAAGKRHKKTSHSLIRLEQHEHGLPQSSGHTYHDAPGHTPSMPYLQALPQSLGSHAASTLHVDPNTPRLQSHQRLQITNLSKSSRPQESTKRKYDDMTMEFNISAPTPKESYERSRPQTPNLAAKTQTSHLSASSPRASIHLEQELCLPSNHTTRPSSPLNPSFSIPATPPDLYLVTRNSPNLSQSIWENFQPEQLFPESANLPTHLTLSSSAVSKELYTDGIQSQSPPEPMAGPSTGPWASTTESILVQDGLQLSSGTGGIHGNTWTHNGRSPDSMSSGSVGACTVPTTLNVEDWYHFFGLSGGDIGLYSSIVED